MQSKSSKTGSVCCVASRPRGGSSCSVRASDGCSSLEPQHRWRVSGGFSPPLSSRWDPSSSLSLNHHQPPPQDLVSSAHGSFSSQWRQQQQLPQHEATSSSLSRSASRAGSGRFNDPFHHQRDPSDNNSVSSSSSPPDSFRAAPRWTSRDASIGDFASASSDSLSRTSEPLPTKEGCVQTRVVTLPETSGASSCRYTRDSTTAAENSHRSSFRRNLSGSYSSLSKLGSRAFFRRQNSDSRTSLQSAGNGCHTAAMEEGVWSQRSEGQQAGGTDWSMQAFSQLVASSQREGFGMLDTNSLTESLEEGVPLSLERIRVASSQNSHRGSPDFQRDLQMCGLCSRWLFHRSPWSSQRMLVGNIDLPVVGVLVCGHVFHADCLDKAVPETLRHDPPCPQCDQLKNAHETAHILSGFDTVKAARGPIKSKLSKIGPQLWKKSFLSAKSSSAMEPDREKGPVSSSGERGFLHRSLSKRQFSFRMKSSKDVSSQTLCSKKFSSPAQVSPENQF